MSAPRLRNRLPPLYTLIFFEAAARAQNFSRAAEELHVSQSAVSKGIRILEEFIGEPVFSRQHRSLELTANGRAIYKVARSGLHAIADVVDQIRQADDADTLTVTTTIALAQSWLMPHINTFKSANPDISVKIVAQDDMLDLPAQGIDCAIRYGSGDWPGVSATKVFDEMFFPVCSPAFFTQHSAITDLEALCESELLHFESPVLGEADWLSWFAAHGVKTTALRKTLSLDNYPALIEAAMLSQGVLLGATPLIDRYLRNGQLVRIGTHQTASDYAYYFAVPTDSDTPAIVTCFYEWIVASTAEITTG